MGFQAARSILSRPLEHSRHLGLLESGPRSLLQFWRVQVLLQCPAPLVLWPVLGRWRRTAPWTAVAANDDAVPVKLDVPVNYVKDGGIQYTFDLVKELADRFPEKMVKWIENHPAIILLSPVSCQNAVFLARTPQ